jgi:hypothetical protein
MKDNAKTNKAAATAAGTPDMAPGPGAGQGVDPITVGLQHLFAAVIEEPIPDDFMALLDRIEAAEREREPQTPPNAGDSRASR